MEDSYDLRTLLMPQATGEDCFEGVSPQVGWQRVFGGQVVGQALSAAQSTVEGRLAHSLHAYFLRPGDPAVPITYRVDRVRDGQSFTVRRVVAHQHGKEIFMMITSFHPDEAGLPFQRAMPHVPGPHECPSDTELHFMARAPENIRTYFRRPKPIEFRVAIPADRPEGEIRTAVWICASLDADAPATFHQAVLAYLSDLTPIDASLAEHGLSAFDKNVQPASLDHAVWFHRAFDASQWHLFVQEVQSTQSALGLSYARIYNQEGVLIASVAQEGLIRTIS